MNWPSSKASRVLAALLRIGWSVKRQAGTSHRVLQRTGWARRRLRLPRFGRDRTTNARAHRETNWPHAARSLNLTLAHDRDVRRRLRTRLDVRSPMSLQQSWQTTARQTAEHVSFRPSVRCYCGPGCLHCPCSRRPGNHGFAPAAQQARRAVQLMLRRGEC
jgi:hypothetical protein